MSSRKSRVSKRHNKSRKSRVSKKSKQNSRRPNSRKSRKSKKPAQKNTEYALPKTMKIPSKKTKSVQRVKVSRADPNMSMSDLEFMAKSLGIPFGGLNKTQLARKINNYF